MLVAAVFGRGTFYYFTLGSVVAVLALSANTSFADSRSTALHSSAHPADAGPAAGASPRHPAANTITAPRSLG